MTVTVAAAADRVHLARRALGTALLLGVLADLLLRDGPVGLGLLLWTLNLALMTTELVWRRGRDLGREGALWLVAALFFAGATAWRGSEQLAVYDLLALLAALGLLAMVVAGAPARAVVGARVRDLIWATVATIRDAAAGVLPLAFRDVEPATLAGARGRTRSALLLRTVLVTVPLLFVFGALLRTADPLFASLVALPELDLETVFSHVVVAGFFTWIVGGWLRGALLTTTRPAPPERLAPIVGAFELTVALGALDLLFAAFVAVQLGWLFGGDALVRATTGLGYAQYARHGFFELLWVSILVVPVLLVSRMFLADAPAPAVRRWRRLAAVMLLLVGAMMVSALGRMWLYVRYYGLSMDRLFATTFMLWLAIVFGWLALTVLRNRPRLFAGGMVVSGFATLALLNLANPEWLVARVNLARTPLQGAPGATGYSVVDIEYLARLDGDAMPLVVEALLAPPRARPGTPARAAEVSARCNAVRVLVHKWIWVRNQQQVPWTRWTLGQARAQRLVERHERALRAVTCLAPSGGGREEPYAWREMLGHDQRRAVAAPPAPPPAPDTPGAGTR